MLEASTIAKWLAATTRQIIMMPFFFTMPISSKNPTALNMDSGSCARSRVKIPPKQAKGTLEISFIISDIFRFIRNFFGILT
jgi:hypothetical protein